jgi:prepilin-type N-terminal cleavage/methylation domain-containing protein
MLGAPREGRISAQRGLTLVEIMVVLAIVGAITVAMAPAIGSIFGARLVGSCNRLSGMVRYAYNLATLTGKVHRIVVNVGEGTYVVEEVEQKGECQGVDLLDEDKKDSGPDLSGRKGAVAEGEETPEEGEGEAVVGGKEVVDKRVRKETLPGGVKFTGILTKHNKAVVEDGTESIYFFPDGTAEKALVWLTDGEDTFTVEVKALQGTGMVHAEELDSKELSKK